MFRRVGPAIGVAFSVIGFLAGCSSKPVVGVLLPTTGDAASYGESIESGVRLALTVAREQKQLPSDANAVTLPTGFEVVWADTGSQPERAVTELRKMVEERGVKMVIGGATSAEALALIPVLDELEIVCLSPSASAPGLAEKSRMFFRIYPSDELEGHTAGKFLYENLAQHRVLLFTGNSEYIRGIEPEFLKEYQDALGGAVIARISVDDDNWQGTATTVIRREGPQAVYAIGYAEEILAVLHFLHEQGFAGRIVTTSAFYNSRVIHEAGDAAEGVLLPLPPFDRTSDKEPVLSFVNRYMDAYQRAPDVFAAHGYDAMRLAIHTLDVAKPPVTTEILKALRYGGTEFTGVTGPILFDDYGDVKHYPKMFIIKDGQLLSYQRYLETERKRILNQVQDLLASGG